MAELPVGILIVLCDYAFSEVCSICSDNNFDVLEIFFDGNNSLVFYDVFELEAVGHFCENNVFEFRKYILSM